jgi:hypothetical protein
MTTLMTLLADMVAELYLGFGDGKGGWDVEPDGKAGWGPSAEGKAGW